ncbi:MAG: hypothetical protein R3A48_22945 [Polyangiales bacterium]
MRAPLVMFFASLAGCASAVDGSRGSGLDASAPVDVPPGRNADGLDPFRPADVAVAADASPDVDPWNLRDATVFDQRTATMSIGLLNNGNGGGTSYFSAAFRLFPRADDPRCEYVAAANWSVQRCRQDAAAPRDTHPTPFPNAGEIRASGGSRDLILRPTSAGTYSAQSTSEPVIRDGSVMTIRSSGNATVPALSIQVPIPPALAVTAPSLDDDLSISRAEGLVVTWRPIAARLVNVTLQFVTEGTPRTSVRVDVQTAGDEGRAVVPARALRDIEVAAGGLRGSLSVQATNLVLAQAGPWPLQITAFGRGAAGTVRLR